jgi:hypothetical protein
MPHLKAMVQIAIALPIDPGTLSRKEVGHLNRRGWF